MANTISPQGPMSNLESGNETELIIENIKVDIKVQDKYFSPDFLGKW